MEHPFYGSWGYQMTGFFAPTSRQGTPDDLMFLIDTLHQKGVGVLLDWVPSHFPTDGFGISYFDGTHLFEHADPRQGFHPDWQSSIFNYGRREVTNFLVNSGLFWLEKYHADGIRVDAVASMLYLDYSRKQGEWIPNQPRRPGEPRSHRVPQAVQRAGLRPLPRHADVRGGVDRVARRLPADLPRRPGLRLQVGHGLDARHAEVLGRRPGQPQVAPQPADVPVGLRLHRELRPAAVARRVRPRQGVADQQDAGRRLAEAGQPAAACSRTSTPSRARSCCSWAARSASTRSGTTTPASTGTCCTTRPTPASPGWSAT